MTADDPHILPFGNSALVVVFGEVVDLALNARAHALTARLSASPERVDGRLGSPVPGHASVLVPYDPVRLALGAATAVVEAALSDLGTDAGPLPADHTVMEVPVRYGGQDGPDLAEVADRTGLSPADVISLHAATRYQVFMLGFAPGFAYLGMLPPELDVPRRAEPRVRVAAGSVAIAGRQTCIYPFATPGGWNIIGRTDATLWDLAVSPPARLRAGDLVRFVPLHD